MHEPMVDVSNTPQEPSLQEWISQEQKKGRKKTGIKIAFVTFTFLIVGLYILAKSYKESADKAACIINLSSFEKGIHSYL